jgi:hypothetical protein
MRIEDAEHLAIGVDDPNLRDADAVVDTGSEVALTIARVETRSSQSSLS